MEATRAGTTDALHLQRIGTKLDSFIIAQAYVQGTWLLWVEPVLYRISQWGTGESNGPEMLERFMRAIVRWSRAIRGRSRLPTNDPELRVAKQKIVGELKILQNAIRAELAGKRRFPDRRRIISLIEEKLRESESVYVYPSGQNLVSLLLRERALVRLEVARRWTSRTTCRPCRLGSSRTWRRPTAGDEPGLRCRLPRHLLRAPGLPELRLRRLWRVYREGEGRETKRGPR